MRKDAIPVCARTHRLDVIFATSGEGAGDLPIVIEACFGAQGDTVDTVDSVQGETVTLRMTCHLASPGGLPGSSRSSGIR
jgi:hypothetical protein